MHYFVIVWNSVSEIYTMVYMGHCIGDVCRIAYMEQSTGDAWTVFMERRIIDVHDCLNGAQYKRCTGLRIWSKMLQTYRLVYMEQVSEDEQECVYGAKN
jgi:hypothetical protein